MFSTHISLMGVAVIWATQAAKVALTALGVTDRAIIQPMPQSKPALMDFLPGSYRVRLHLVLSS